MRRALVTACVAAIALASASAAHAQSSAHGVWSFVSAPGLRPPTVSVSVHRSGTAPGYIFVAPLKNYSMPGAFLGQTGPLLLDQNGNPVWVHPVPRGQTAMNFNTQTYRGRPVLTWWQGVVKPLGYGSGVAVIVDQAYRTVAVVRGGNGYSPDLHDFVLTPSGTAYFTAYRPVSRNLSRWHGPGNGQVMDAIVQGVDVRSGRVVFQWDPLAHGVKLDDSFTQPSGNTPWDAIHLNSIDVNSAGNLLISARNTSTVYAVSRRNGAILWRLGGKRSSLHLGHGLGFHYQHDASFAKGNTITLFDNGAAPVVEHRSRTLVVVVDSRHHSARLQRQYAHPRGLLAGSQGSMQLLANGDVFAGWGAVPYFSEFSPGGQLIYDAHFHGPDESYRAFKAGWTGRVPHGPALAARRQSDGSDALYMSWNGETDIASWQVLAGPSSSQLQPVVTVGSQGFETTARASGHAFQVRALDSSGAVLGGSAVVGG